MRDKYYQYISEHNINDLLSDITELSYSQKIKLIRDLRMEFDNDIVCQSLNTYHMNYIKKGRVRLNLIYNTLKGMCQRGKK